MALVGYVWFAVDVFFVQRSLHMPVERVGFLWTASGVGGLMGSAGAAFVGGRVSQRGLLVLGLGSRGLALLWYANMTRYVAALPAAWLAGLGDALVLVALGSLTLQWAPSALVGRTTALIETAGQLGAVAALIAIALWQAALTPAQALQVCSVVLLAVCVTARLLLSQSIEQGRGPGS
jgi:hypothetical protein